VTDVRESVLGPFECLLGTWEGECDGMSGRGKQTSTYELILDGKFLQVKNEAVFPPSEKKPIGETHRDIGFFSCDKARNRYVYRCFFNEGFVTQYTVSVLDGPPLVFTLESESIENGRPGMRAREVYKLVGQDEMTSVFELAFPGKDFQTCLWQTMGRCR